MTKKILIVVMVLMYFTASAGASGTVGIKGRTKSITLIKDHVVEITFMEIHNNERLGAFYKIAVPVSKEYGGHSLTDFSISKVHDGGLGKLNPNFAVMFQYPSVKKIKEFYNDKRIRKALVDLKASANGITRLMSKVSKDQQVALKESKTYELYTLWMSQDKEKAGLMKEYSKAVSPLVKQLGASFPISLKPIIISNTKYVPQAFGVAEWPSVSAHDQYLESETFNKNKHYRTDSLMDMIQITGKVVFYQ